MKLTVVSICLNNKDGLQKTIESVINQTAFNEIEYIIIDGGSTDGSLNVIKEYQEYLDYWISEPDDGIYYAMNKAIEHCHGEYTLYLNSGDYLCENNVIEKVIPLLDKDIVYGNEWKYKNKLQLSKYPDRIDAQFWKSTSLPHQSTFIKTELLKAHPYSTDWKVISDWVFLRNRIVKDKVSYKHINIPISVYDEHGFSFKNHSLMLEEKKQYYSYQHPH